MLVRPKLTKPELPATETQKSQAWPLNERFLLRVDGQTKRSFRSKEPAMTAGGVIKKAFPIVLVTIEDTADGNIDVVKM